MDAHFDPIFRICVVVADRARGVTAAKHVEDRRIAVRVRDNDIGALFVPSVSFTPTARLFSTDRRHLRLIPDLAAEFAESVRDDVGKMR